MHVWMDVMRGLERVLDDSDRLFDAWAAGGVTGLVIGPMNFDAALLHYDVRYDDRPQPATFTPDEALYRRMGGEPPTPPGEELPERRKLLEATLTKAVDRGWQVWLFTPAAGMGPGGAHFTDPRHQDAFAARTADTLAHYPMVHGGVHDGPEWGYEIAPHHYQQRSYIFNDLPAVVAPACARLGYDYAALVAAKDRLFDTFHGLTNRRVAQVADGGLLGAFELLGRDVDLLSWLQFRVAAVTDFFSATRERVDNLLGERRGLGVGPRTACFGSLAGYDFAALAGPMSILLPKHYFWHRGFDGLYGTVGRWVETLVHWNEGLSEAAAFDTVALFTGLRLPGVTSLSDLDRSFPPEFFTQVVQAETRRALAAVDDPVRIVPWLEAGRRPHAGDSLGAGELRQILEAAREAGLQHFVYHHAGNLSAGEWLVMSELCGQPWRQLDSDYLPPDEPVL